MNQVIHTGGDARKALLCGVKKLSNVVASTLGPSGHSVILDLDPGNPIATKDGVTVAKAISLPDHIENAGAQMLKQASIKTAEEAGDGTTTATVLASNIYSKVVDTVELYDNSRNIEIKQGMEAAAADVTRYIQDNISRHVSGITNLKQVATISANGDEEIGKLVSRALDSVGLDGAVTLEESKTGETYLDIVEGIQFDRGYKSPYFVTDNDIMTAVLEDVVILITDKKLTTIKEMLPVLEGVSQSTKSLLIIAEDIDGELLSALVLNKLRAGLKVCAVKAPEFGERRKETLEDIATLTGGTVISPEKGMNLEKFDSDWLGTAKKVTVDRDKTTIVGASGNQEEIDKRIEEVGHQIESTTSSYDKEQLQNRLARLAGGVAVMYVGGHTELEMKERKDRVDDALHATRAALEEGICPGGGRALLAASLKLKKDRDEVRKPFELGYDTVLEACKEPFMRILNNAGMDKALVENLVSTASLKGDWESFIPQAGIWEDMYAEGIVDPTKVIRLALKNAVSVAGTMATSEALVVNIPDKKECSCSSGDSEMY